MEKLAKGLPSTSSAVRQYIAASMEPIGEQQTLLSYRSAAAVQSVIQVALQSAGYAVSFDYQGSVTNNTHIRVHSDIDLLVVTEDFVTLESSRRPSRPYHGDPVAYLTAMRAVCETALAAHLPSSAFDCSGAKAVAVFESSSSCKVDLVPANWYNTVKYSQTLDKIARGVQVLDRKTNERIKNFPFFHNFLLDRRDQEVGGSLRRLIRLIKGVRSDSDNRILVSSYDIAALCFNLPDDLWPTPGEDFRLVTNFLSFCRDLLQNNRLRASLSTINGDRQLFGPGGLREQPLIELLHELVDLVQLANNQSRLAG